MPDRPAEVSPGPATPGLRLPHHATARHRRRRLHRLQLRPLLGGAATPTTPWWPTTPSPTPGTGPTWPTSRTGSPSSRATSVTSTLAARDPAGARHRHRSSTSPPSPTTAWPSSTRAGSSGPTCSAPRPCSRRPARPGWPASTTSRPARSTATSPSTPTTPSPRSTPTGPAPPTTPRRPAPTTPCGPTSRPSGCRPPSPTARNNYGPYQFPEKVIPLFTAQALDDRPLPLYASTQNRREWLHVDRPLPGHRGRPRARAGSARPTTSAAGSRPASRRSPTPCSAPLGKPETLKKIVPDRPGHDRRYLLDCTKIRPGARLGADRRLRRGPGRHRAVVRGPTGSWWEPLVDRAPVVETSWGDGPPTATVPPGRPPTAAVSRPRMRVLVTGGGRPARHATSSTPSPGGCPTGGRADDAATGPPRRSRSPCDVIAADHRHGSTSADRGAVLAVGRGRSVPTSSSTAAAWTAVDACEARPRPRLRRERPRHPPRRRGGPPVRRPPGVRLDRLRLRRHLDRPLRGVGPARPPVGLRAQQAGRRAARLRPRRRPWCGRRGCAAPTAPTWSRPCSAWPRQPGPAALRRRPAREPDLHRRPRRGAGGARPPSGSPARST